MCLTECVLHDFLVEKRSLRPRIVYEQETRCNNRATNPCTVVVQGKLDETVYLITYVRVQDVYTE